MPGHQKWVKITVVPEQEVEQLNPIQLPASHVWIYFGLMLLVPAFLIFFYLLRNKRRIAF